MAASSSQGQYSVLMKMRSENPSVEMKMEVWLLPSCMSSGPIRVCSIRSPGNPGTGSRRAHPTRESAMPASPVGCIHWSFRDTSVDCSREPRMSTSELVSTTIGAASKSGGWFDVIPRPRTVSREPQTNSTAGAVSSMNPRARRSGMGCRSGLI